MAKDRESRPDYQQRHELVPDETDEDLEVLDEDAVEDEEAAFEQPVCPRCGWHNTRISHTSNIIDFLVRSLGLRAYRCRSCGNRFRVMRRIRKA